MKLKNNYMKANAQIWAIARAKKVSGYINVSPVNDELLERLIQDGYVVEQINDTNIFVSWEKATFGKALKKKYLVARLQYRYIISLIEYHKNHNRNCVYIYSTEICILQEVCDILKKQGYIVSKRVCENKNDKFYIFDIKWR